MKHTVSGLGSHPPGWKWMIMMSVGINRLIESGLSSR